MKNPALALTACLSSLVLSSTADIIWNEDFDALTVEPGPGTNQNIGNVQAANGLTGDVVEAPAGLTLISGNALLLSSGTLTTGAIRPSTNPLALPAIADGLSWTIAFDIYIPTELSFEVGSLQPRWKDGSNTSNGDRDLTYQTLAAGEHHIEYTGTFPIDNGGGPFLPTNARPFIFFTQDGAEIPDFVYFDNLTFDVEVSSDDPNLVADAVNFGSLVQDEGPYSRPLVVSNTGNSNTLTVTGATPSGLNAAEFSVTNTSFPLNIEPGTSQSIEVTFAPGSGLGDFTASLDIESNDESDATIPVNLSGSVSEPFDGNEFIKNGSFETGDLSGWEENPRYTFTDSPARSGVGAAAFTFDPSIQYQSTRLATTPPLGLSGEPRVLVVTPEMIGQSYEYSAWYYRPSVDGMAADDSVATILRWNRSNTNSSSHGNLLGSQIPFDTWVRVVGSGTIPAIGGDENPTTSVEIAWSYRDINSDNPGGQIIYIDDVSWKVDAPLPELELPIKVTAFAIDTTTGEGSVTFDSVNGLIYELFGSSDLGVTDPWEDNFVDDIDGEGASTTLNFTDSEAIGQQSRYYRVEEVPE